jgi:hypothetical protein
MDCEATHRSMHIMNVEDGAPPLTCGLSFAPIKVPLPQALPPNLRVSELEQLVLKAHNVAYAAAGAPLSEIILPLLGHAKLSQIPAGKVDVFVSINRVLLDSRRLVSQYTIADDTSLVEYHFELQKQPSWAIGTSGLVKFKVETCATTQSIRQKVGC